MANTKISALTSATTPVAGTEVLPIVQSSTTKQVSIANLTAGRSVSGTSFVVTGSTIPANGIYLPATNAVGIATNTTNAIYVDASQNVGIGTSSPAGRLDVQSAEGRVIVTSTTGTNASYYTAVNTGGSFFVGRDSSTGGLSGTAYAATLLSTGAYPMVFGTNSAERARIDSSGNLGIGTNSPQTKLSVETSGIQNTISPVVTGQTTGVTYGGLYTVRDGAGDQRGLVWQVYTANVGLNEKMRLSSTGIVTMSAYGAGAATFSAAGVISSVSDETWKIKDGVPVDPDSMLKKLEPGYWYYNDEKKETFGSERQLGFYAQNVNAAIGPEAAPEPSSYTSKGLDGNDVTVTRPWGYYDRSVLAITVMSLQKALATIESLTARIEALEAKNP
jgi:hypothetical protein